MVHSAVTSTCSTAPFGHAQILIFFVSDVTIHDVRFPESYRKSRMASLPLAHGLRGSGTY